MNQLAINFDPITRARRSDPVTSQDAAQRAMLFACSHEATCFGAIHDAGDKGATAKEIAALTKLTDVQVSRRLGNMGERGLITRKLKPEAKGERDFEARGGCAVWFKT